jgi:type I restriction enzyme S subunit
MVKISHEHILSWITPLPPISEQEQIVGAVQQKKDRIDLLIAEATHAIDLLQERRTALISAAVIGKIDVRGLSKKDISPTKECTA